MKYVTLLALIAIIFAGGSMADQTASVPSATQNPTFAALDVDNSGTLSKSEAEPLRGLLNEFDNADVNKDGLLDEAEFAALTGN